MNEANDYHHCGFYKCKFYGNTVERRIHIKAVHTIEHDCHASEEDGCDCQNFDLLK